MLVNHGSEGKFHGLRMGRLRARTNRSGVVGVGALAMEAARGPEGVSIIHHSNCACNPGFALISCQVFPLVPGPRSLSSDVAKSSVAGCNAGGKFYFCFRSGFLACENRRASSPGGGFLTCRGIPPTSQNDPENATPHNNHLLGEAGSRRPAPSVETPP